MLRPEIGEGCGGAVRVAVGDAAHASCSAAARASRTASAPAGSREQSRQRLFDEMGNYCTKWLTDTACAPNALKDGSR